MDLSFPPAAPHESSEPRGLQVHEGARGSSEDLRHEEGLRQEALHLRREPPRLISPQEAGCHSAGRMEQEGFGSGFRMEQGVPQTVLKGVG